MWPGKAPAAAKSYRRSNEFKRDAVMGNGHLHIYILALWIYCAAWVYTKHWDIKSSLASWLAVYCRRIALELDSPQRTDLTDKVNTLLAAHACHSSLRTVNAKQHLN